MSAGLDGRVEDGEEEGGVDALPLPVEFAIGDAELQPANTIAAAETSTTLRTADTAATLTATSLTWITQSAYRP